MLNPVLSKVCKTIHDYLSENKSTDVMDLLTDILAEYIHNTAHDEPSKYYAIEKTKDLVVFIHILETEFSEWTLMSKEVGHA